MKWQTARVVSVERRTDDVKSFFIEVPEPFAFKAGQHLEVRLTAPDGYRARRSYSIASGPESAFPLELIVERLPDGEVSPFFHDVLEPGDSIEVRGPIGGHFVWSVQDGGPVLLIGAGSGVVPLLSMIRHRARASMRPPMALLLSSRTLADRIAAEELERYARDDSRFLLFQAITREPVRPAARLFARRIDDAIVSAAVLDLPAPPVTTFICGSNGFVNRAADAAIAAGIAAETIRTERYGG